MAGVRWLFLGIAIWGAIHPMYHFIRWFQANGIDLVGMVAAWNVNAASSGLVWDLTIAAIALSLWVLIEMAQTRRFALLLVIPATFCIGVSCGLPLYFFLRLRPSG